MKPKILIDSISLLSSFTGIGRYTYEIAKHLEQNTNVNIEYFYGYYSKKLVTPSSGTEIKSLKSIIVKNKLLKKLIRKLLFTSSRLFAPSYDMYWQPAFIPNNGITAKSIVTSVHDFSFILYKDFHPKERIEYMEKYFFKNIVKSDIIITGSEYTKKEILERLDFSEDKIKVIHHGIDHNLFKVCNNIEIDFKIPSKFILSVGSIEPRKNLLGLLNAYNMLNKNLKKEYKLVLVGFKGWENNKIMHIINQNKENIYYLGFVNDEKLVKLYNLSSLFVFPSFYEGFGLPPLEAMACGTPVLSSNLTSMPEVCLDAAIYFNPNDTEDIKNKIELVLNDIDLQNNMIEKGIKRAKQFSWKKSANEHMKVFESLL
ncbi:MAG: glycosyltransferase family 4 protein [Flavobacteriaceae bacterium]|nr:glycosyltransferase family 4 protein [Flavobacteriaceae bacterium]